MADRPLSLIHFLPSFAYGGQQRRLATLVEHLGQAFKHRICSLDGDISATPLVASYENVVVEPFVLAKSGFLSISNIATIRAAITRSGADLLCTYNFGSIEAAVANKLGARLPHVHHEDGFGADELQGELTRRAIARRVLLGKAQIVVPSQTLEKIAIESWRIRRDRLFRIRPGIDLNRFSVIERKEGREIVVGAVGALRAEKNFLRLIRCFEAAAKDRNAHLVIYGEGPERAALEGAIADSPLRDRMRLMGAIEAPEKAYSVFDVFALTSDTEQTPISLMEAMASGLPVVATDVGDVSALLSSGAEGNVFAAADETAFSRRLAELLDDQAARRRLGERNAETAKSFDQKRMIELFRSLYLDAANER